MIVPEPSYFEVHITLDPTGKDPELIRKLLDTEHFWGSMVDKEDNEPGREYIATKRFKTFSHAFVVMEEVHDALIGHKIPVTRMKIEAAVFDTRKVAVQT